MEEKCEKIGHSTRDKALKAMEMANKKYKVGKNKWRMIQRVYKCPFCELWHLTSHKK